MMKESVPPVRLELEEPEHHPNQLSIDVVVKDTPRKKKHHPRRHLTCRSRMSVKNRKSLSVQSGYQ